MAKIELDAREFFILPYHYVDDLIQEHFAPRFAEYSCVAAEEWSNDTAQTMDLHLREYNEDERQEVQDALADDSSDDSFQYRTRLLLSELVRRDILPEGEYLIDIYW